MSLPSARPIRAGAVVTAAALVLAGLAATGAAAAGPAADLPAAAAAPPGAPGSLSHFDLGRKDCVGTASGRTSRVWFTVADGVLSDVYEPTVDTTNLESLQYVVTDGTTTDLQARDMTYTVSADPTGMACTVTSTARSGRYRLVTTYVADPRRDTVLMRTRLVPLQGSGAGLQVYVRMDATVGGNGGGGTDNAGADSARTDPTTGALVSYDTHTATAATNRDYAKPTFMALRADRRFTATTSGYAGTASDGLTQLDAAHVLTRNDAAAPAGNVVQTARLDLGTGNSAVLALGFGRTSAGAVGTAGRSLARSFTAVSQDYRAGWRRYDAGLRKPPTSLPGLPDARVRRLAQAYYTGINVVKASEDKTFPGAVVAGLGAPWGQAVSAGTLQDGAAPYFGSYREVFSRDLYEAFTALLVSGDTATARATTRFLFERQQLADGRLPRNSLLNGKASTDTGGDQLDETAYPILMAEQSGLGGDATLYRRHIRKAADFLVARGPSFGNERWEEQSGYSPSTIAAEIAGLVAAGRIAARHGDPDRARLYLATADHFQRSIQGWTVTTTGPYSDQPYFLRLSKTGDPDAAVTYNLGNGGPDADQRAVVDGGFQELTRLGELSPADPVVRRSLGVVDRVIRRVTPSGPGWYRYGTDTAGTEDGYGDCYEPDPTTCAPTGKPWPGGTGDQVNKGSGHLWPVLSGERAEQILQTGNKAGAAALLDGMDRFAAGVGLVPEQAWEDPPVEASPYGTDPSTASIGFQPGRPAGSAAPLTWAQAQEVRLALDLGAGKPLEQPGFVRARYVATAPPARAPLTVTAPAAGTEVGSSVTVTGTTAPGARVVVAATGTDLGTASRIGADRAGAGGKFSVRVPVGFGTTVVTTTATTRAGATAYDQRSVSSSTVPGTLISSTDDPAGDDHGPGTFAYPLNDQFHAGAFDLRRFSVYSVGADVWLQTEVGNLDPTFGDPLGAQLLSVFVHQPGAARTSTAPFYASRNYTIARADAWSRALQVRGFEAPRFVRADGSTAGPVQVLASALSRTITVIVPAVALGGVPGPGWTAAVVLHGQDGLGQDNARTFTPTPGDYTFGVCAAGVTDPRCAADPGAVPKAMDVLTPPGVSQASELDVTKGPVVIAGVPIG